MTNKLLPLIPAHSTYVEAFAGAASLFFAKEKSDAEVLNDLDSGLVNFYRVLRDPVKYEQLQVKAELTPYSREEYYCCRDTWDDCDDDVERAARWFIVARQCFSGIIGSGWGFEVINGRRGMTKSVAGFRSAIENLPEFHWRLRGVQVERNDFRKIIQTYDRPATLFYLDPPYVSDTRRSKKVYRHEMTNQDHEELVQLLLRIKGKAMLSGYVSPIYDVLELSGWERRDLKAFCAAGVRSVTKNAEDKRSSVQKLIRQESVWLNYRP